MTHSVGDRGSHTPGPWRFDEIDPQDPTWEACEVWTASDGHDRPIATMVCGVANARLIAAAPTVTAEGAFLLNRLADFERTMEAESGDAAVRDWHGHVAPAIARFRAAIQSATGEG